MKQPRVNGMRSPAGAGTESSAVALVLFLSGMVREGSMGRRAASPSHVWAVTIGLRVDTAMLEGVPHRFPCVPILSGLCLLGLGGFGVGRR